MDFNIDNEQETISIKKHSVNSSNGVCVESLQKEMIQLYEDGKYEEMANHYHTYGVKFVINQPCLFDLMLHYNNNNFDGYALDFLDTSQITDMSRLFAYFTEFNCDISSWDVSNVTTMADMFNSCYKFNCDISGWDVSNVMDFSSMFEYCKVFNQDLSRWDANEDALTASMFFRCAISKENKPIKIYGDK